VSNQDNILTKLGTFLPWLDRLLGKLGSHKQIQALHEIYEYMEKEMVEQKRTWTRNDPQNVTHVYLDKMAQDENKEDSSFNPKRKLF